MVLGGTSGDTGDSGLGGNADSKSMELGETDLVQGNDTGRKYSLFQSISAPSSAVVEGVGLDNIPSCFTSNPTGTSDVAGSQTWSDMVGLGSGRSVALGPRIVTASGPWSAVGSGVAVVGLVVVTGARTSSSLSQMVKGELLWRSTHSMYSMKVP